MAVMPGGKPIAAPKSCRSCCLPNSNRIFYGPVQGYCERSFSKCFYRVRRAKCNSNSGRRTTRCIDCYHGENIIQTKCKTCYINLRLLSINSNRGRWFRFCWYWRGWCCCHNITNYRTISITCWFTKWKTSRIWPRRRGKNKCYRSRYRNWCARNPRAIL